jgi:hypothetical protein
MQVQATALFRALNLLRAAGVQFAVLDHLGVKHGELEIATAPAVPERKARRFRRGSFKSHYFPYIKDMKAGESTVIPFGDFGVDAEAKTALRGSVSSHCSANWGLDTYITHVNDVGVEVLRVE